MKTTYISRAKFGKFTAAIAAAALLAGTAAPGVLAADYTAQLTKTIDMTAAPGRRRAPRQHHLHGRHGREPAFLGGRHCRQRHGRADQIHRAHRRLYGGTVNTVPVPFTFDSDDFTAPGDYIFSLTETAAGITGLTQDTAARYIVVRVVNTDPAAPTGALRISDINIVNADGTARRTRSPTPTPPTASRWSSTSAATLPMPATSSPLPSRWTTRTKRPMPARSR